MPESALLQYAAAAADPVVLLSDTGSILWKNKSYDQLASRCDPPGPLATATLQRITKTTHYSVLSISMLSRGKEEHRTALVADISSGDPGSAAFLVTLKPTASDESRLAAREELLATVAHDLRNPIGAIFSYADALLDTTAGDGLKEPQREIVRRIRSTAARCVEMVLNYQFLSQLKLKGLLKARTAIDINQIVRSTIESTFRDDAQTASVTTDLSPKVPAICVDTVHIERIVSNLLYNALKYTPASGSICIKTEAIGKSVQLIVTNTGVTVPEAELPRLFDRYQRASSSQGKGGSGLGLYIVKSIAEANGGSVAVTSDASTGVRFTVTFPM